MKLFCKIQNTFIKITGFFKNCTRSKIAIDLGTANTLIYCLNRKKIIINEPSVVAVREVDGECIVEAAGEHAKQMLGRAPDKMYIVRPLKDGVISDFDLAYMMLKKFIDKAFKGSIGFLPKEIIIGTPSGATSVEKRAIKESIEGDVKLIPEPLAAAIGAGIPIGMASGNMVVDIGGGTTEIAVLSLGGIVVYNSIKIAGDKMDEAIINMIRRNYNVVIGYTIAENIKKELGTAMILEKNKKNPEENNKEDILSVTGRDIGTGMPKTITVDKLSICNALNDSILKIIEEIKITLSKIEPELSADIMNNGITLTGGGALLKNIDLFMERALNIKIKIADNPLYCVVNGLGKILEDKNITSIIYDEE